MTKKEFIEALKGVPDDAQMVFVLNNKDYIYPYTNWVDKETLIRIDDIPYTVCTLHFCGRGAEE